MYVHDGGGGSQVNTFEQVNVEEGGGSNVVGVLCPPPLCTDRLTYRYD